MKTIIIIPAYNESENIEKVVDNIINNFPEYDYIIINDASTDNTEEICRHNHYNYISLPTNLGIGGGVQTGYQYALHNHYDIAVQVDGDGQHNPAFIQSLIQPIIDGKANIVIGSRFIEYEGFQSSSMRRFGIKFLSLIIKMCCGAKIKDVTSGFRAVDHRFIELFSKNYSDDYPEPEAIVFAKLHGGKILEMPVTMEARTGGQSSISPLKSVYYMIKVSLAILFSKFTFSERK